MSTVVYVAGSFFGPLSPTKGRLYLTLLLSLSPLARLNSLLFEYSKFCNYLCFAELENGAFRPLSVGLHFTEGRSEPHHASHTLKAHCIAALA